MKTTTKIVLITMCFLLVMTILTHDAKALDSDVEGDIPDYVAEYLSNGSTNNATGDYSNGAEFFYQPSQNESVRLFRLIVTIKDVGINNNDKYGDITALNKGVSFWIKTNGTKSRIDGGLSTKTNGDYIKLCYDMTVHDLGNGDDYVGVRWTFANSGTMIRLDGSQNDSIIAQFNDSMIGLSEHTFLVQGYKEMTQSDYSGGDNMYFLLILAIPILFVFLLGYAAFKMDEEHQALKWFAYLLIPVGLWGTAHLSTITVIKFYPSFNEMINAIGVYTEIIGWLSLIIYSYVVIYLVYKLVHTAAQKKNEKLNY